MIEEVVPQVYDEVREYVGIKQGVDLSRLAYCGPLAESLHNVLASRDIFSRLELHELVEKGKHLWHVLVAHEEEPSSSEIITDLCPWQFVDDTGITGFYHGPRQNLVSQLTELAFPGYVRLIQVDTITVPHITRSDVSSMQRVSLLPSGS